jgi:hypothetical protein
MDSHELKQVVLLVEAHRAKTRFHDPAAGLEIKELWEVIDALVAVLREHERILDAAGGSPY